LTLTDGRAGILHAAFRRVLFYDSHLAFHVLFFDWKSPEISGNHRKRLEFIGVSSIIFL